MSKKGKLSHSGDPIVPKDETAEDIKALYEAGAKAGFMQPISSTFVGTPYVWGSGESEAVEYDEPEVVEVPPSGLVLPGSGTYTVSFVDNHSTVGVENYEVHVPKYQKPEQCTSYFVPEPDKGMATVQCAGKNGHPGKLHTDEGYYTWDEEGEPTSKLSDHTWGLGTDVSQFQAIHNYLDKYTPYESPAPVSPPPSSGWKIMVDENGQQYWQHESGQKAKLSKWADTTAKSLVGQLEDPAEQSKIKAKDLYQKYKPAAASKTDSVKKAALAAKLLQTKLNLAEQIQPSHSGFDPDDGYQPWDNPQFDVEWINGVKSGTANFISGVTGKHAPVANVPGAELEKMLVQLQHCEAAAMLPGGKCIQCDAMAHTAPWHTHVVSDGNWKWKDGEEATFYDFKPPAGNTLLPANEVAPGMIVAHRGLVTAVEPVQGELASVRLVFGSDEHVFGWLDIVQVIV